MLRLRRDYLLISGLVIVGLVVVVTGFAPLLAPFDPTAPTSLERLQPPGRAHLMGTDQLQRDVLSRVLYGGRIPILVAVLSCALSLGVGTVLGWISGYAGGRLDRLLSLTMDAIYSFPGLILAIAIVAMLGPGLVNMTAAIAFVYIPTYFRVARGQVLAVRAQEFVEAARALGASGARTLFRHVAPNTLAAVMTVPSFNIADAILTEAALSFLGFGLPPPTPDWGFDIQNGQKFLQAGYWWLITFPGLMIIMLSVGFGMIGEGINDRLNPRRRRLA
ncbi:MAG: ABC transporter permease [Armatimonadota bacterium]|nr:ABC transporter permease [Armatimonadota bacterium]MDR7451227.1 ABC transporter permease [Armatimonadota bacterium]MDR7466870.1 ABC transporter permease [Armatimonadota bacterium]MDR7492657.1 ABC transporter permease [Armatimonadota bacterium]MDR7499981.1 ABC transporter permease [Armatimonadota bacterium]